MVSSCVKPGSEAVVCRVNIRGQRIYEAREMCIEEKIRRGVCDQGEVSGFDDVWDGGRIRLSRLLLDN